MPHSRISGVWEWLLSTLFGERCPVHSSKRISSVFGCETCFRIQWRKEQAEADAAAREERIQEIAEGVRRAKTQGESDAP
jgi:hypothetical protein